MLWWCRITRTSLTLVRQWGKLTLTCVTWPWSSRGRGHFNHTCSEMCDRPHQMLWWCRITRTSLTLVRQWGKLTLTCVTWPWSSEGRGHFNHTCSEMCDRPHQMLWWCRITRTSLTLVRQWGKLTLTCVTWPWFSRGRGHFNDTCSEM